MNTPTLFLMFGYPGAGKTTVAKIIQSLTGAEHVSSDLVRLELFPKPTYTQEEHDSVYSTLDERAKQKLKQGRSVIYDGNLNRKKHRIEKYNLCDDAKARPLLVWIKTPKDLARDRAVLRGHRHLVPKDETFESMFDRVTSVMEKPGPNEPIVILDGTNITPQSVKQLLTDHEAAQ